MSNKDMADLRVNDLLCFMNFKRKINSVADVVAICESFYSAETILDAKKLFFDCVAEKIGDKNDGALRFVNRRGKNGENPQKMNLEDLLSAMNKCDSDGIDLPKFVSSDLSKIPSSDDGNISLTQIMFMLVEMKNQISSLEKKSPCDRCFSSSTPSLVPPVPNPPSSLVSTTSSVSLATSATPLPHADANPVDDSSTASAPLSVSETAPPLITEKNLTEALAAAMSNPEKVVPNGEWNEVVSRKTKTANRPAIKAAESRVLENRHRNARNLVIGKKPSSGVMTWSGANLTVESYVGRVDFSVTSDMIKTDLISRGIDVIDIEPNETRHSLFKSFRLILKKTDFDRLNVPEAWPEGVVFRRFRRPRPPPTGHVQ